MKIPLLEGKTVNSIQFFFLFKFEAERWNNIQRTAEMIRLVLFFSSACKPSPQMMASYLNT